MEELNRKTGSLSSVIVQQQQRIAELEGSLREALRQNEKLKPLLEFIASFESQEELQTFLDLLKTSSTINFPEHKLKLVLERLEGNQDKRLIVSEIFQEVWEKISEQTIEAPQGFQKPTNCSRC